MVTLGSKVKDNLTGFGGIAIGRAEFMYGCARVLVEPDRLDKDGKPIDAAWFDEQRINVIKAMKPQISKDSVAVSGGPQKDPSSRRSQARS